MLPAIFMIIGGLILIANVANKVPVIGKYLEVAARWLAGFTIIVGIINIILGLTQFIIVAPHPRLF